MRQRRGEIDEIGLLILGLPVCSVQSEGFLDGVGQLDRTSRFLQNVDCAAADQLDGGPEGACLRQIEAAMAPSRTVGTGSAASASPLAFVLGSVVWSYIVILHQTRFEKDDATAVELVKSLEATGPHVQRSRVRARRGSARGPPRLDIYVKSG